MAPSFSIASALSKGKGALRGSHAADVLDLNAASDPTDWVSTDFGFLKALDSSLRCTLCYDIYTAPVVLRECHHTFCSVCIRSHINQPDAKGRFCPQCRQTKVSDGELVPVQGLEEAAEAWRKARPQLVDAADKLQSLLSAVAVADDDDGDDRSDHSSSSAEVEYVSAGLRPSSSATTPRGVKRKLGEGRPSPPSAESSRRRTRQSTSAAAKDTTARARQGSSPTSASSSLKVVELKATDLTQCPICDREFTLAKLNVHLDKGCDGSRGAADSPPDSRSSWFVRPNGESSSFRNGGKAPFEGMSKMVRPQYVGKSDILMRKLLEKDRLPTSGSKERMVARHRQWINIFNANLDAAPAKRHTEAQLRRALSEWDRGKDEEERHRSRGGVVSDDKAKTWVQDHKSEFAQLVERARSSHHQNKDKTRSMPIVRTRDRNEDADEHQSSQAGLRGEGGVGNTGGLAGSSRGSRVRQGVRNEVERSPGPVDARSSSGSSSRSMSEGDARASESCSETDS
ncbi:hypothetical protein CF319_g7647 [Tilletia indica]|uniref:Postreplication repair E3 ubiquitin-protein ligase RAD18 n=2 Tax=Tilletia TaxID=13289 RepID=A0A8X7T2G8_9BASI|nr:hypothetical protein CF319_g7647 [Tilletia indica]KAE8230871.1 hypothetical protein CF326_g4124 [Tilletia indica]KAE8244762.1 hypothetical protein A4X13_0g6289 [Tilletia indica]KAE8265549.1 hypothetical protein A4X09_0g6609 [Tilletia walkeri]